MPRLHIEGADGAPALLGVEQVHIGAQVVPLSSLTNTALTPSFFAIPSSRAFWVNVEETDLKVVFDEMAALPEEEVRGSPETAGGRGASTAPGILGFTFPQLGQEGPGRRLVPDDFAFYDTPIKKSNPVRPIFGENRGGRSPFPQNIAF